MAKDIQHAIQYAKQKGKPVDIQHAIQYNLPCRGNNAFTSILLTCSATGTANLFAPIRPQVLPRLPACFGYRTTVA